MNTDKNVSALGERAKHAAAAGEAEATRCALATLRRLKLQESLLAAGLGGAPDNFQLRSRQRNLADKRDKDYDELMKSFYTVNSLFEKLKHSVTSDDCVKKMDIAEYKKLVTELEDRITFFKKFLNKLMNELRESETILSSELKDIERNISELSPKLKVKPYSTIMTSSVKALRNTPSACSEVERFQTYLKEHGGHRGGWGDQEHYLFVRYRQKYLKRRSEDAAAVSVDGVGADPSYIQPLAETLMKKIPGLTADEVLKHDKWYTAYACLKCEQQEQLERWKTGRRLAKQHHQAPEDHLNNKSRIHRKEKKSFDMKSLQMEAKILVQNIQEVKEQTSVGKKEEVKHETCSGQTNLELEASFLQQNILHLKNGNSRGRSNDSNEFSKDYCPREISSVHKLNKHNLARNQNSLQINQVTRPVERPCRLTNKQTVEKSTIDSLQKDTMNTTDVRSHQRRSKKDEMEVGTDESAHYLLPTKQWSMRSVRSSSSGSSCHARILGRDLRLHIPMANSPKLGISNWRRCLIGEM